MASVVQIPKRNPDYLFSICSRVVKKNPHLEKELFKHRPRIGFVYTHERIIKEILGIVSRPYLLNNKSFERWFRKFIKENIFACGSAEIMLDGVREVKRKIIGFKKVFGVVEEVFLKILMLEIVLMSL